MPQDRLAEEVVPVASSLLTPSHLLQGQLLSGITAVVAAGALSILASVVQLTDGLKPGFTLAHGFAWASLVPLLVVLRTYQALAREADSAGLRQSALGLFGTFILFQVLELITLNVFPLWGQITIWIVFGLSLLALVTTVFVSEHEMLQPTPKQGTQPDGSPAAERVRWGGGLVLGLLVLLKLAGKGLLVKLFALRMVGRLLRNLGGHWEILVGGLLTLVGAAFIIWFAIAKIRLRGKLGNLAVLLGVAELVLFLGYGAFYFWSIAEYDAAVAQPGANPKALQDALVRSLDATSIAVDLIWSTFTALFFQSVRARFDPDREWLFENAE
jgi:hypothetical protein